MIPTRPQVLARLQLRRLNLNKISTAGSQAQRAAASQATNAYEHTNQSEACWIVQPAVMDVTGVDQSYYVTVCDSGTQTDEEIKGVAASEGIAHACALFHDRDAGVLHVEAGRAFGECTHKKHTR